MPIASVEAAASEALFQVKPLDVAHGDEEDVLGHPGLVDRDDVRMVDRRGQLRLTQEAVAERFVLGEAGSEELQRDLPLQPQIFGQVDHAHAAPAEQRLDPVAGEFGAYARVVAHVHVRSSLSASPRTIGGHGGVCEARVTALLQRGETMRFAARGETRARG